MNSDFRQRILLPIVLPVGALLAILAIAYSLSRVLLAVEANLAVFIALGIAAYVLLLAFLIERRPRISSRALAVGTTLALVAVVGSGVVAAAAGARSFEHDEPESTGAEEGGEGNAEVPEDAVVWTAGQQLEYTEAPTEFAGGEVTVALVLEGLAHNVVFEELGDQVLVEGEAEGVFTDVVTIEPGEYTYYCSLPGHREAGMEGTVTVS